MKTRKKLLSLILAISMAIPFLPGAAVQAQALELGTPENPIRISTETQLKNIKYGLKKHYVLTADIRLTGGWDPIGPSGNQAFTGTFDGNWHTISDLAISGPGYTYYGLFGYINGAEIRNLRLHNVNIAATQGYGSWVGSLAGYISGNSIIENCHITGAVSGSYQSRTGGFAGVVAGGTINQCFAGVNVTSAAGNAGAGGLAGSLSGAESIITNSYTSGSVFGYWAGGLAGILEGAASVEYSYAAGAVSSSDTIGSRAGGLIGMKTGTGGQVISSYYDEEATGQTYSDGGTPKTTSEMQTATPFEGWDTDIWHFESGEYPAFYHQRQQYYVAYDLNGVAGTVTDSNAYGGFESVTAASPDGLVPPAGKTFKEWNTAQGGSGFARPSGGIFGMPDKDITLYAIWDTPYAVYYDLNTGTGTAPSSERHFAGDAFAAAGTTGITAPWGKQFKEWNTAPGGDGTGYGPGVPVNMPAADLKLFAIWEMVYTVTYHLNKGTGTVPVDDNKYVAGDWFTVESETGIMAPSGKQFKEWNTDAGGDGTSYDPWDSDIITSDITLYAIWEPFQDGSEAAPYLVSDFEDLERIMFERDKHYLQTADITLPDPEEFGEDSNWSPTKPFSGFFDGGGFTISNLIVNSSEPAVGLFGIVAKDAVLKNIKLVGVKVTSTCDDPGYACVGALAGYNAGTIQGCTVSGAVSGKEGSFIGGLVGINEGFIENCTDNTKTKPGSGGNSGGRGSETPSAVNFVIPSAFLSGTDEKGEIAFNSNLGNLTVSSNLLSNLPGVEGKRVVIIISPADKNNLSEEMKAAIGSRPLISITMSIDGRKVGWSNPDAPMKISIPYTPTAEELLNPESIVIWYIDGDGNAVTISNGYYDEGTKTVTFYTTHLSDFAVAYNPVEFSDVAEGAWYHEAVSFIAARGITAGTGNGNFSPDAKLTRGDFVALLMRAYGISPDLSSGENFSDAGNTYYTGYLKAAKTLGISGGVGNNLFAPGKEITRQEMFTLMYNILRSIDQLPRGGSSKTIADFSDGSQIAPWAADALSLFVKMGLVEGNGGKLDPAGTATRAQMAQVLYRLELLK